MSTRRKSDEESPSFLGEIETEIVGMDRFEARIHPGEQINLERELNNAHDKNAIRVENGHFHQVGYLPRKIASWLAPLIDSDQIYLDGYVPKVSQRGFRRCPVNLMVFHWDKTSKFLDKAEPADRLEALHQRILEAYGTAQTFHKPETVLALAEELRLLEEQELLPESWLLLALLPRMAHELQVSKAMQTTVTFRGLLNTITIGEPSHHHNLTFFPIFWPQNHEPSYILLGTAIEAGLAVVEEVSEAGSVPTLAVINKAQRPLLIPEGEILVGAKQNRVINITVLVAAGEKFLLPVTCVEAGRWRHKCPHFESKHCAPPSLRTKKLKAVNRNRSAGGAAASNQHEVWDEVQACLDGVQARSETASLTDAFAFAEETLRDHCKRLAFPDGAAGILVGRHDRIIGMDLFDSPTTLKTQWDHLSDAYFFDALRDPRSASPTDPKQAEQFVERLGNVAKPRVPALALGDELEITGKGLVGAALLYEERLCHLVAFSDRP